MGPIEIGRRRIYFLLAACVVSFLLYNLFAFTSDPIASGKSPVGQSGHPYEPSIPEDEDESWDDDIPPSLEFPPDYPSVSQPNDAEKNPTSESNPEPKPVVYRPDAHPITTLMQKADAEWRSYESSRSQSFRQTVEKYRSKYGRHPPPGFKEWYIYARQKNVWNIDDFDHIMDDLRPFWAIDPRIIRTHAAHMWEDSGHGVAGIHIRNGTVAHVNRGSWRSETMTEIINLFVEHLPDMDIMMNRLDQPRLLVPWEDLQALLTVEQKTRVMPPEVSYNFSTGQDRYTNLNLPEDMLDESEERFSADWFGFAGKQYMDIASKACPPGSPARSNLSIEAANAMYKELGSGLVTNFNLSSDLCTVGPTIHNLHGLLYSASSISASHKLVPIFSECKVNVNNDIMFPANMYYRHDPRYDYDPTDDIPWREKADTMIWRGVTSGGVQIETNWQTMHRQRLVQLMNGTHISATHQNVTILSQDPHSQASPYEESAKFSPFAELGLPTSPATYHNTSFSPAHFADKVSDVGFVESWGCVPDCSFYDSVFSWKPQTSLTSQFRSKYLIDVDGHSFSGRWHAFLQSKSLGFKATIFREWHDSRLFAWRHFVPVDNRYDDLYSLLTYFVGYGTPPSPETADFATKEDIYVPAHQTEAKKLARQGREWANKVLRRDDIEVYMYRLLLEYGRIIDDNRDRIGYSGDGSELDRFDAGEEAGMVGSEDDKSVSWGVGGWFGGKPARPSHGVSV